MKTLLIVLAAVLCCVLIIGLIAGGSGLADLGGDTTGSTAENTTGNGFAGTDPVYNEDLVLARYSSDIPDFAVTYNQIDVGARYNGEASDDADHTVSIVLGSVKKGDEVAVGYTFAGLKVGQQYLLSYSTSLDVPESFDLTHYYFRQGSAGSFMELAMPDLTNGCILFTAQSSSVDLIFLIVDAPAQEVLVSYGQFLDESTYLGIAEVVAK